MVAQIPAFALATASVRSLLTETHRVFAVYTTKNYFTGLGVPMLYGRGIIPTDPKEVAVLRYQFWRKYFNSDPPLSAAVSTWMDASALSSAYSASTTARHWVSVFRPTSSCRDGSTQRTSRSMLVSNRACRSPRHVPALIRS